MTTIACVLVNGHVKFTRDYVARLQSMVARFMDRPYRFVCLTDHPARKMPAGVDVIPVRLPLGLKGWWAKIELFNPDHRLSGRVLYLDLDTLVVAPLAPILDFQAAFALAPNGASSFTPSNGLQTVKRFNSSVMVWHADLSTTAAVYWTWVPAVASRLWGDQDWIGEQCPHAAVMPGAWFPRVSELGADRPGPDAKVVLCKVPKNVEAAQRWPWVQEAWA